MAECDEMGSELREFLQMLVEFGFEIDLSQVDYKSSLEQMEKHKFFDFSEVGCDEELHLAELRNLLRAVYFDGGLVVNLNPDCQQAVLKEWCQNMKTLMLGIDDASGEASFLGLSFRRVIHSSIQVKKPEKIIPGHHYMICRCGKPADLVLVTAVQNRLMYYKMFLGEDKWSEEKHICLSALGVLPQEVGPDHKQVWDSKNYLEPVM